MRYLLFFGLLTISLIFKGQGVEIIPANPSLDDSIKVIFYADRGNKALQDYDRNVYMHTGVLTDRSLDSHDWKHTTGNWGTADKKVRMTPLAKDIFTFSMRIRDFYHIPAGEKVQQLAFVFRNRDGSIVAKKENGDDFTVPVNGYFPELKKLDTASYFQRQFLSYEYQWGKLKIKTNHGNLLLQAYTNDIIRVSNRLNLAVEDSSAAVILSPSNIQMKIEENEENLIVKAGNFEIEIRKFPVRLRFSYRNHFILEEEKGYYKEKEKSGLRFSIQADEKFWGLGERAIPHELNGEKYELYNKAYYGYEVGAKNLNYSVPLLLSSQKYILFFDNPSKGSVDIGKTNDRLLRWEGLGANNTYYITGGKNYRDLMKAYFQLTGKQEIPPRWAFGHLMSRMAYRSEKELDSIVRSMRQAHFPIDAAILDFYWFGDSIKGTMGRLEWYKPHWPNPRRMIENLRQKGIQTILITEPYVLDSLDNFRTLDSEGLLAKDGKGNSYIDSAFYFGHGGLIDIFNPRARKWFWEAYKKQIAVGVAGWWGDLGEPESHPPGMYHVAGKADEIHNIYAHYWEKMLYERYRDEYPERRLFDLNRAGYAGSQRFSVFPWTGDVRRSWRGLQAQIPLMLHAGISGLPYIHSDAGGFALGKKDEELYIRWLQMAAFSPIFRPHGSGIPSEAVFFSDTTQDIVREAMYERYRLLPYFYTLAWKQATLGELLVKPLFFNYPEESGAYNLKDSYLLGDQLLIHPVLNAGEKQTGIYLPEGLWYDYYSGKAYEGGNTILYRNSMRHIPVFVRSGSFIIKVRPVMTTAVYRTDTLWVNYYPTHRNGTYNSRIYEDDGHTRNAWKKQQFEIMSFFAEEKDKAFNIRLQKQFFEYVGRLKKRRIILRILSPGFRVKKVSINGQKVLPKEKSDSDTYFISGQDEIFLFFPWGDNDLDINLKNH